jgi:hypothetical protein
MPRRFQPRRETIEYRSGGGPSGQVAGLAEFAAVDTLIFSDGFRLRSTHSTATAHGHDCISIKFFARSDWRVAKRLEMGA